MQFTGAVIYFPFNTYVFKMASLVSAVKAQDTISCQLCEMNEILEWKCLECELLMCMNCYEKIHPKFKNAKDHRIINIQEVGSSDIENIGSQPDFTKIKCKQHANQISCLYCTICEMLVCPICIASDHCGHKLTEIKQHYQYTFQKVCNKIKNLKFRKMI